MEDRHCGYEKHLKRGGTRKIADPPPLPCTHPEHDPAGMIVREPGTYEHICPSCGKRQVFTIRN